MTLRLGLGLVTLLLATANVRAAAAADPVVASSESATVTAHELQMVLQGLPAEQRAAVVGSAPALEQLLRGMLLQDALFAAARSAGFDRRPAVALQAERGRQGVVVQAFISSQLTPPAPPDEARIQAAYAANQSHFIQPRQYHLAQIFHAGITGNAKLEEMTKQLAAAPDGFGAAARAQSEDQRSAQRGGDLGWIAADDLAEPVRSAVAGMQVGSVSGPLHTTDGWHLIRLLDTRPAGPAPLAAVRTTLIQALSAQDRAAATRAFLADAARRSSVQIDAAALAKVTGGRP